MALPCPIPYYVFDGTFYGLLTAVFEAYERRHKVVNLVSREEYCPQMFAENITIVTDTAKAKRVWEGLKKKISPTHQKHYYSAFLSEQPDIFRHLFQYAVYIFDHPQGHDANYGHDSILSLAQMSQKVHREKHRMEAFIRFRKSSNGLFFAVVNPDYNVLPLVLKHFTRRYADQPWIIYDARRKYGIHYDLHKVQEVTLDPGVGKELAAQPALSLDGAEELYNILWKDYFKSTNIVERKNLKLHIQHVPKRYWKYLTEKEAIFSV